MIWLDGKEIPYLSIVAWIEPRRIPTAWCFTNAISSHLEAGIDDVMEAWVAESDPPLLCVAAMPDVRLTGFVQRAPPPDAAADPPGLDYGCEPVCTVNVSTLGRVAVNRPDLLGGSWLCAWLERD